jgi:hypothetical protein
MLPLDTEVYAPPEVGAELKPSPTPPDPRMAPEWAKTQLAFAVRVPRVTPNDPVLFHVETTNPDNWNAAKQILRVREEYSTILKMVIERIEKSNPEEARTLNFDKIMSLRIRHENIFSPVSFSYEAGRQMIEYFTDDEQAAHAFFKDIHDRHTEVLKGILDGRPRFIAPVIRIRTTKGEGTYADIAPNINYCFDMVPVPFSEVMKRGGAFIPPAVPKSYEDGFCK